MAKIIDFEKSEKDKFYKWAEGHLHSTAGKDLSAYPIEHIICKLVKSNVLTLDQIRAELKMRKIQLHEEYFEKAAWLIDHVKEDNK